MTITVCAGRWGLGLGGSGGVAGLSGERQESELAEWRSQGSELAEWRSQERELAESAAGRRTVKSGCRTEPAQAVYISTSNGELWRSHWKGLQPSRTVYMNGLSHACDDYDCQCSLCLSMGLMQRTSQTSPWGWGSTMGQWVVERWPTVHSNSAPKMGAARNWVLRGHCRSSDPTGLAGLQPLAVGLGACCRQRAELGVGQGQGDGGTGVFPCGVEELEVAGDSWQTIVLLARQPGVEVEWLEEAGGSWKAMLLAVLSQLRPGTSCNFLQMLFITSNEQREMQHREWAGRAQQSLSSR